MGLPKQVEEAATEAEEYLELLNNPEADEETDTEEASSEVDTEEEVEEVEKPEVDESELYKNKYLTLKGKYDAEVPTLHSELKELKENIFGKIEELSSKQNEVQTEVDTEPELDAFREEFGDDLVDFMEKRFARKDEIAESTKEALKPVEEKLSSVEDSQVNAAKDEFATYLNDNVNGDWNTAASDPAFVEFLDSPDPSGLYTYGELMALYNENWNHEKMAKVFNLYYGDTEEVKPKSSPEKEAMVAPSRKTKQNIPESNDKPIWTEESIKQFEKDDRAGKYSAEESTEKWNDLLSALGENRIK